MIPNITRGGRAQGLMAYLVGGGRHNEHQDQRLIAGDDRVTFAVSPGTALNAASAFELAALLDEPARAFGTKVVVPEYAKDADSGDFVLDESGKKIRVGERDAHVWHCSLALRSDERTVSDQEWERIAHSFVERMGFVDPDGRNSSRWVAVHHGASAKGNDHIHIAVQLVTEAGNKASVHNDFHRAQKTCRALEREYGLTALGTELGQGLGGTSRADMERAERAGRRVAEAPELRRRMRAALATAPDLPGYLDALGKMGVQTTGREGAKGTFGGYSVTLGKADGESAAVWRAPSKLDPLLSWPKVVARFAGAGREEAESRLLGQKKSMVTPRRPGVVLTPLAPGTASHLEREGGTPDTLANIYARVSMSVEKNQPGALSGLSEHLSRMSQGSALTGSQAAYLMRLNHRFGSRNAEEGWLAVLRQANRLAKVMLQGRYSEENPGRAAQAAFTLAQAEAIVNREAQRLQGAGTRVPASAAPGRGVATVPLAQRASVEPARPFQAPAGPPRPQSEPGRESDYGR